MPLVPKPRQAYRGIANIKEVVRYKFWTGWIMVEKHTQEQVVYYLQEWASLGRCSFLRVIKTLDVKTSEYRK